MGADRPLPPCAVQVIKSKAGMRIAYLTQEFDVEPSRTLREEFTSAFGEQMAVAARQEEIQRGLEECGEDMERMAKLLGALCAVRSVLRLVGGR